jgi:hypothetical protein
MWRNPSGFEFRHLAGQLLFSAGEEGVLADGRKKSKKFQDTTGHEWRSEGQTAKTTACPSLFD